MQLKKLRRSKHCNLPSMAHRLRGHVTLFCLIYLFVCFCISSSSLHLGFGKFILFSFFFFFWWCSDLFFSLFLDQDFFSFLLLYNLIFCRWLYWLLLFLAHSFILYLFIYFWLESAVVLWLDISGIIFEWTFCFLLLNGLLHLQPPNSAISFFGKDFMNSWFLLKFFLIR